MTMPFEQRIKQKMIAWIAVFAILCHALMPSIAHMRADATSIHESDFCPAHLSGTAHFPVKSGQSPLDKFNAPRCGFCVAGISFAPPPFFHSPARLPETFVTAVRLPSAPVPKLHEFTATPPRGPPFLLS